jgi:hypothetical protein
MPEAGVVSEKSPASVAIRSAEGPNGAQTGVRGTPRRAPGGRRWTGLDKGKECRHQNGNVKYDLLLLIKFGKVQTLEERGAG